MTAERIISGTAGAEEEAVERAIRPRRLEEYVGQARVKMQLEIFIGAARRRGAALERPGDLAALLTNLQARDVLFVDEIHRLAPVVEEVLYPAMEDYQLDL